MKSRLSKVILLSVFFYVIFLSSRSLSAEQLISVNDAIKKIFVSFDAFEEQQFAFSKDQIAAIEKKADILFVDHHSPFLKVYTVKAARGIIGYAFEDTVNGKWGPIHYLVGVDPSGIILDVVILDYKEIRGKPISKKRFLKQYKGKSVNDAVALRKDIDGITGATISSRSLTDGVRKILKGYQLLKDEFKFDM